jgi:hypothetical protein
MGRCPTFQPSPRFFSPPKAWLEEEGAPWLQQAIGGGFGQLPSQSFSFLPVMIDDSNLQVGHTNLSSFTCAYSQI